MLMVPILWVLKSFVYWLVFRIREIQVTVLSCLIIGGSHFLLTLIPFLGFLALPIGIGVAVYLTMQYTQVSLIPDGLFIPLGVEAIFLLGIWLFTSFF